MKGKRARQFICGAASICLALSVACEGVGRGAKSDTLSRETALSILSKYSDNPTVLRKNLYSEILIYVSLRDRQIEQTRTRRGICPVCDVDVDYLEFLEGLSREGILKAKTTRVIGLDTLFDTGNQNKQTIYSFEVVPQADVQQVEGSPYSPGCCPALRFKVATQKFARVIGIQIPMQNHAIVDVAVTQDFVPVANRVWGVLTKTQSKTGDRQLQLRLAGCSDCVALPLQQDAIRHMPFTKYDDGWRLGY